MVSGGSALVVSPEGRRQAGQKVEEVFVGIAYVAAKPGVPIIPVGIGGSEAMLPKGAKLPRRSKLVLVVGEPIPAPAKTESGRMPRSAVSDLTAQLDGVLQRLFDHAQPSQT